MLSASVVTFVVGAPAAQVVVSEQNYSGAFIVSSSNASVAMTDATRATGPSSVLRIVARSAGVAFIRVSDEHGAIATLRVVVVPQPSPAHPQQKQQ